MARIEVGWIEDEEGTLFFEGNYDAAQVEFLFPKQVPKKKRDWSQYLTGNLPFQPVRPKKISNFLLIGENIYRKCFIEVKIEKNAELVRIRSYQIFGHRYDEDATRLRFQWVITDEEQEDGGAALQDGSGNTRCFFCLNRSHPRSRCTDFTRIKSAFMRANVVGGEVDTVTMRLEQIVPDWFAVTLPYGEHEGNTIFWRQLHLSPNDIKYIATSEGLICPRCLNSDHPHSPPCIHPLNVAVRFRRRGQGCWMNRQYVLFSDLIALEKWTYIMDNFNNEYFRGNRQYPVEAPVSAAGAVEG